MQLPIPITPPAFINQPSALMRVVSHADVTWNRPQFKAPPLDVRPPLADVAALAAERRRELSFVS